MKLTEYILGILYPSKCVLCRALLKKEETDLCRSCRTTASRYRTNRQKLRGVDAYTAVWYYEDRVRESLLRYKFSGARSYAGAYGRMVAMAADRELPEEIDLVTWVPIGPKRKRKRGYDQCELLALEVAKELELPVCRALHKAKDNKVQSSLSDAAQRRANVLGVYSIVNPDLIRKKNILLLDDIITTGATVSEAARMLKSAGAGKIYCAAVAAGRNQKQ